MQGVKSYVPKSELELPKVIVIGGKSAGKSSLLENITKCSVFPRDRDLCTKRPVKLQLKQVDTSDEAFVHVLYQDKCTVLESTDAILGEVDRIMKPLSTIADDEIIIRIGQVIQTCLKNSIIYADVTPVLCDIVHACLYRQSIFCASLILHSAYQLHLMSTTVVQIKSLVVQEYLLMQPDSSTIVGCTIAK